jgi:hypothetical protein
MAGAGTVRDEGGRTEPPSSRPEEDIMKKTIGKVKLNRETLHTLETAKLAAIAGGAYTFPPVCEHSNARIHC